MIKTQSDFEREFHSRTLAYHPEYRADGRPVVIRFSDKAHSEPGHALLVSLVNQLARAHKHIIIVGNLDQLLLCADHFGFQTLSRATAEMARAINPFIDIEITSSMPNLDRLLTIGIGGATSDINLGADGWLALLGPRAKISSSKTSILGAALAACLGASVAFHKVIGAEKRLPAGPYSLWDYARHSARQGPNFEGPVDVGKVLQVGAGAVGSGLAYWLKFFGVKGDWTIVDGDVVDISNLNRQLLFLATSAGFPDTQTQNKKATLLADQLGPSVHASTVWYGEDQSLITERFDLVLPLANERAVRPALQQRPQTVLLHGTTSPNWEAQVHRHVAGRDDCISCRLPEDINSADLVCSAGTVGTSQQQDASLPFLSATASLLLIAEIIRLQEEVLVNSEQNYRAVSMHSSIPVTREFRWAQCAADCRSWMPPHRRLKRTAGSRFNHLDGDFGHAYT